MAGAKPGPDPRPLSERFWPKVAFNGPKGCWLWTAGTRAGYGSLWVNELRENEGAHRIAYFLFHGKWPAGLVCHTCDERLCVNPAHLVLGSHADNAREMAERGRNRNQYEGRTHCKWGHEFNEQNTRTDAKGRRFCRPCQRRRYKEWSERRRE